MLYGKINGGKATSLDQSTILRINQNIATIEMNKITILSIFMRSGKI